MAQIQFIPNDPLAGSAAPPIRSKAKRRKRSATRSDFELFDPPAEGKFEPGTPEFLFWQCREAGLATLEAFEAFAGPHKRWQGNRQKLELVPDAGVDVNAFYDRSTFSFFHKTIGSKTFFSGNSTDVVAHEIGHGLLDTLRPDLWDSTFLETGAFHEAFGDCIAVLTAIHDPQTRKRLLSTSSQLRARNFVEATAEELSDGIRRLNPNHNAAAPRHALNTFKFQLPETLPLNGPPGTLINEVHSFGMLFSGSLWDVLSNIFESTGGSAKGLLAAAKTTGALLVAAARTAPVRPRFFQSIGRSMVLADEQLNGGAHREQIKAGFERHGILLGSNAMLAPSIALAGAAPSRGKPLQDDTRKDLMRRLGATRSDKLSAQSSDLFGEPVTRAVLHKQVDLAPVDKRLRGVVAVTDASVAVGGSGRRAAVVGSLPEPTSTDDEVHAFVKSLLAHDRIDFRGKPKARAMSNGNGNGNTSATHAVVSAGPKRVLQRIRFH